MLKINNIIDCNNQDTIFSDNLIEQYKDLINRPENPASQTDLDSITDSKLLNICSNYTTDVLDSKKSTNTTEDAYKINQTENVINQGEQIYNESNEDRTYKICLEVDDTSKKCVLIPSINQESKLKMFVKEELNNDIEQSQEDFRGELSPNQCEKRQRKVSLTNRYKTDPQFKIYQVYIVEYNNLKNSGIMQTQGPNPVQIQFHRDDFKKKFWIVKQLIAIGICFNIVAISDNTDTRLFLLDPIFINQFKALLAQNGIKNTKKTNIKK